MDKMILKLPIVSLYGDIFSTIEANYLILKLISQNKIYNLFNLHIWEKRKWLLYL